MKPALTAEEWADQKWVRKEGQPMEAACWGSANVEALNLSQDGELIAQLWRPDRHALAAIALYGQPFGFTREDVEALRCAALLLEDLKYHTAGRYQEVRTIADRIEALLPPDTGFTVTKPAEHASGSSGGSFSATSPAPPTEDQ